MLGLSHPPFYQRLPRHAFPMELLGGQAVCRSLSGPSLGPPLTVSLGFNLAAVRIRDDKGNT